MWRQRTACGNLRRSWPRSSSATGCSGRGRTGPRSPRSSRASTVCCCSTCPSTGGAVGPARFDYERASPTRWRPPWSRSPDVSRRGAGPLDGREDRRWFSRFGIRPSWSVSPVVDVAPVDYDAYPRVRPVRHRGRGLDLSRHDPPRRADRALIQAVPIPTVRGFLLRASAATPTAGAGNAAQPGGARRRRPGHHRLARGSPFRPHAVRQAGAVDARRASATSTTRPRHTCRRCSASAPRDDPRFGSLGAPGDGRRPSSASCGALEPMGRSNSAPSGHGWHATAARFWRSARSSPGRESAYGLDPGSSVPRRARHPVEAQIFVDSHPGSAELTERPRPAATARCHVRRPR